MKFRVKVVCVDGVCQRHTVLTIERAESVMETLGMIPFAKVADLLCDVLPVRDSVNAETVRTHLQAVPECMEEELGEERQGNLFEGLEAEWEQQPLPDGRSRWAWMADTCGPRTSRGGSR